ncbi:MAG: hypothetical protein HYY00_03435 [Chloroflexi bacterium]|nr:hypothetical protein [Chloroflexota bacterium]
MYKRLLIGNTSWNMRTATILLIMAVLPNLLGALEYVTVLGYRVHFFQGPVFLAAAMYGPLGGGLAGAAGSVYTAASLGNPYIVVGNLLLGGLTGLFLRFRLPLVAAVLLAYLVQLPFLWATDVYLVGMPVAVVQKVVIALLVTNIIWALVAQLLISRMRRPSPSER